MSDPILSALKEALTPVIEEAVERGINRKLDNGKVKLSENVQQEYEKAKQVLSDAETRKFLDVSKSTLARWRRDGVIPYSKVRGKLFYRREDLLQVLEQHKVNEN